MDFSETSYLLCIVKVGPNEYAIGLKDEQTKWRTLYSFQYTQKMGLAESGLCSRDTELIDLCFTCSAAKPMKSLCWRPKDAILFWKIPAPIHPAKNAAQAAPAGKAGRDPPVHSRAVEFCVFATVTALPCEKLNRISERITQIKDVNRCLYDLTPKPPATIEYI